MARHEETQETESQCIGHEPCPSCGSRDNLGRYDDGHGFCFGCGHYEKGEADSTNSQKHPEDNDNPFSSSRIRGEARSLAARGISEETCRKFGYAVAKVLWDAGKSAWRNPNEGEAGTHACQVADYFKDRTWQGQKLRFKDKKFCFIGSSKSVELFGQHLFKAGRGNLVITEGEIDCLSVSQAQNNKWPVVSIPTGSQSAVRAIKENIQFVESFNKVILMFDMDDPGQEAAVKCAAALTPGKVYIASLPLKDANECLVAGRSKEIIDAIFQAKEYRPDGVKALHQLYDGARKMPQIQLLWPWDTMTLAMYGRRRGEIYGFGGGVGCGKTEMFKDLIYFVTHVERNKAGLLFLEEDPELTAKVLAGKIGNKRYHVPRACDIWDLRETMGVGNEGPRPAPDWEQEDLDRDLKKLDGMIEVYDHFGSKDYETIRGQIKYMVQGLGIKDIFLDHLTALTADVDDERRSLDFLMADLASLAKEMDFTLYFISHLTTPKGKPHEEGGRVFEKHFTGSRAISRWAHGLFAIERNKQTPDEPSTFRILKDRFSGDGNGVTFGLRYDKPTGRLHECPIPARKDDDCPFSEAGEEQDF